MSPSRHCLSWIAITLFGLAVLVTASPALQAEDWPTYRHDQARSGVTTDKLALPLTSSWTFHSPVAPESAWGPPKAVSIEGYLERRRHHFDDTFQVAAVDGAVFFGSSVDNSVHCLDAVTGEQRWLFTTGGPIRLAPMVVDGRVYVGSDDGWVYCLDASDGSVAWKFLAAPEEKRVLGSGRMISPWPVRTGVLVADGIAYFAAGIFPGEGIFLYSLDAKTGEVLWRNDACGEEPQSRVSPQGYLLASGTTLHVPMGRVSPAAFDRANGRLIKTNYFGKAFGGVSALLAGEHVYTGTEAFVAYNEQTSDRFAVFDGLRLAMTDEVVYLADETELAALDREKFPPAARKLYDARRRVADVKHDASRDPKLLPELAKATAQLVEAQRAFDAASLWRVESDCHEELIVTADLVIAGGDGRVVAFDIATGETRWSETLEGPARGLAVADGRLLVSAVGEIHCFGVEGASKKATAGALEQPFSDNASDAVSRDFAKTVKQCDLDRGYCLIVGFDTGQLAWELLEQTDLSIYLVDPDPAKVEMARRKFQASRCYGHRVTVDAWPLDKIPYADYFADLIVSESALLSGTLPPSADELFRMLKPHGGLLLLGQLRPPPPAVTLSAEALERWADGSALEAYLVTDDPVGVFLSYRRGSLPDAGDWSHLYGNAGNTAGGNDRRLKTPLEVLWFGSPGPGLMVNRHRRAMGPVVGEGRIFVQGENVVMAHDIYNGRQLWQREIVGAIRQTASHDGGNLALDTRGLLVAVENRCLRLDPRTGETTATHALPPTADAVWRRWGVLATADGLVHGSRALAGPVSDAVFAIDPDAAADGKLVWLREGKNIPHNSIALADGRVYYVDSQLEPEEREAALAESRKVLASLSEKHQRLMARADDKADVRVVVALDARSGEQVWRKPIDLTHCGGGNIALMAGDGTVVLFGVYLDGHYWRQFFAGEFDSRRVSVLDSTDGRLLWSKPVGYRVRPILLDGTLHAEPWAFDARTGEPRMRNHPITDQPGRWQWPRPGHHCGLPIACPSTLFFRSYTLGYYDLTRDSGTMHFGAQRPGCWINFVPAGGLLLFPEASTGCMCPFPNRCSVAFRPSERSKGFGYFSADGPNTPVAHLALNFGAMGDRRDADGTLWLGYPRPSGSLVLPLTAQVEFYPGGGFSRRNSTFTPIADTPNPWLFTSIARGVRRCVIPLTEPDDARAVYQVRLGMVDPASDGAETKRVAVDVKIQGRVVSKGFDLASATGAKDRAVWLDFADIKAEGELVVELVSAAPNPTPDVAGVLAAVEIRRTRVLSLGCRLPLFTLSSLEPRREETLLVSNRFAEDLAAKLQLIAPDGFTLSSPADALSLPANDRASVPLTLTVAPDVPAGTYQGEVVLIDPDGDELLRRNVVIEHLGKRDRRVFHPTEDTYVHGRYPDLNKATADVLLIDGGSKAMGDSDHAVGFLKFKLDVPGKPVKATLRIRNAGNPSGHAPKVRLVEAPWTTAKLTYATKPALARTLAELPRSTAHQQLECEIPAELCVTGELSVAIEATGCDGITYESSEGVHSPELVVEFE